MNFPQPVSAFVHSLPHRDPFIWVDEIIEVTENGGQCRVRLESSGLYLDDHGLRQSSLIEFMAQSYGYIRAAQLRLGFLSDRPPPNRAFLVAIQDAVFRAEPARPGVGDALTITASDIRELGPITAFNAVVFNEMGALLASAKLRIFSD